MKCARGAVRSGMTDQEQRIRERAYALWESHGKPSGRAEDHWTQASREIAEEDQGRGGSPPPREDQPASGRTRSDGARSTEAKATKSKSSDKSSDQKSKAPREASAASPRASAASDRKKIKADEPTSDAPRAKKARRQGKA